MSYSKDLSTYSPEWEAILVQFGGNTTLREKIRIGPFEKHATAVHHRGKFNFYRRLVREPLAIIDPAAVQGSMRTETTIVEVDGAYWIEVYDRNAFGPQVHGLRVQPRAYQDPAASASLNQLHEALAQAGLPITPDSTVVTESIEEDPNADQGLKRYLGKK